MLKVVYPGSFDPITYGHLDMIKRSANMSENLVVGVGQNPNKKYKFSFPERVDMICGAIDSELPSEANVEVSSFSWLLVDFAYKQGMTHIIKWIRGAVDFEYEQTLHNAWETQKLGIETVALFASQDKTHVSSSAAKWLLNEQWDIRDFVTLNVKQALESRLLEQYPIGITGTIWSWKWYVTEKFLELWKEYNIAVHNIDLDKIAHYIISEWSEPWYVKVRNQLANEFWNEILDQNGLVDRKILGPIVFWDTNKRKKLDDIMATPIGLQIREEMKGKKWVMLINWALLAEAGISSIANNNIILIDVDWNIQKERLKWRGHTEQEIERRVNSQFDTDMKKTILDESIADNAHWKAMLFANNDASWKEIKNQFFQMLEEVDAYWELRMQAFFQENGIWERYLEVYSELKQLYDTPERLYHNWSHIVMWINEIYKLRDELSAESFMELFFAFLYHDVIYNARQINGENEEQSAQFAEEKLTKLNIKWLNIKRVMELIRATAKHTWSWDDEVMNLMIDIDMSILGSSWNTYSRYIKNIRQEYSCYSDKDFYEGRLNFLDNILTSNIFQTEEYYEKYYANARNNMKMEISLIREKLI